jgi:sporulation protein YlmC with PRC-barrel domain
MASCPLLLWILRGQLSILKGMSTLSLSELLGLTVYDSTGVASGRVGEAALVPQEDRSRISALIVKTRMGSRTLPCSSVSGIDGGVRASTTLSEWNPATGAEGQFLLSRDLLDQQVIDVHGRKVVRVNDVDFYQETAHNRLILKIEGVDVGARGAIRRLLKGLIPFSVLRMLIQRIPPREIPWEFVDLIETDPARRVKLKISHERLAKLHPADIADIVEELAPNEREAVFETLDEEVAAEALEELEPKFQKAVVESLETDRAADIVEEMEPDAAADLLGDLSEDRTEEILVQMQPEERREVADLLEFGENTAAGRMTTEYIALSASATASDSIEAMRNFEGRMESMSTVFLIDSNGTLVGTVPIVKVAMAKPETQLLALHQEPLIYSRADAKEKEFAELFDKYNLLTLPVVDDHNRLVGVITPDDIINMLRAKL